MRPRSFRSTCWYVSLRVFSSPAVALQPEGGRNKKRRGEEGAQWVLIYRWSGRSACWWIQFLAVQTDEPLSQQVNIEMEKSSLKTPICVCRGSVSLIGVTRVQTFLRCIRRASCNSIRCRWSSAWEAKPMLSRVWDVEQSVCVVRVGCNFTEISLYWRRLIYDQLFFSATSWWFERNQLCSKLWLDFPCSASSFLFLGLFWGIFFHQLHLFNWQNSRDNRHFVGYHISVHHGRWWLKVGIGLK